MKEAVVNGEPNEMGRRSNLNSHTIATQSRKIKLIKN